MQNRRRACELLAEVGLLPNVLPEICEVPSGATNPSLPPAVTFSGTLDVLERLTAPSFPLALAAPLVRLWIRPAPTGFAAG